MTAGARNPADPLTDKKGVYEKEEAVFDSSALRIIDDDQ
jgi:hypothetical protein